MTYEQAIEKIKKDICQEKPICRNKNICVLGNCECEYQLALYALEIKSGATVVANTHSLAEQYEINLRKERE